MAETDELVAYYRTVDYTDDERSAAERWAAERSDEGRYWYRLVNQALRDHEEARVPAPVARLIADLDGALERGPLPRDVTVYRGERGLAVLRLGEEQPHWRERLERGLPLGPVYVPGLLSTSLSRAVGLSFAARAGPEPPLLLEIEVLRGVPALYLPAVSSVGRFVDQQELLLPPQTVLELRDVKVDGDSVVVRCRAR